ncbi:MAG: ABC transporter ATP-binding protein [Methanomicrobium sp.]|nr:ABC transporter ATP-binding protein [Methanomicrobium sp.]
MCFGENLEFSDKTRSRIGVLMENNGFFENLTAYENLKYYAELYGIADAESRIDELFLFTDLQAEKYSAVGTFSTGMKRKLGIARAILHRPEVLFLDEPASSLDPEAQKMVRDLILHLAKDESMTVFLSSHNLDEVQKTCSRVAIPHGGKIRAMDSVENLRSDKSKKTIRIALSDASKIDDAMSIASKMPNVSDFLKTQDGFSVSLHESSASPLICRF